MTYVYLVGLFVLFIFHSHGFFLGGWGGGVCFVVVGFLFFSDKGPPGINTVCDLVLYGVS